MLDVGDYLTGDYAVERKSVRDFIGSLFDGRVFDQAYRLGKSYENVLLIVEGDINEKVGKLKNPRWFWGGVASALLDYDMKCFFTPDTKQTAQLIQTLGQRAEKERRKGERSAPPLIVRKPRSGELDRVQVSIVSSLPGVGPKLAEKLLVHFGTVRRVFEASTTEMAVGAGLGRSRALGVRKMLDADYKANERHGQVGLKEED